VSNVATPPRIVDGVAVAGRFDLAVSSVAGISRAHAQRLISDGRARVNGRRGRASDRLRGGERILVELSAPPDDELQPEQIPLQVAYEDAAMLIVDKPAGLVVHPSAGHASGTLVNALLGRALAMGEPLGGIAGVARPGIVHRLDKDTSGLLLIAKHDDAHRLLSDELKRREIRRAYLTASWGHLPDDTASVDAPIGRHPTERKKMAVVPDGRPARTHFRRLERWRAADLLRAELETGRTHQIRVHLLHLGHPVIGDATYAPGREKGVSGSERGWAAALARRVPRQFLHATELRFTHPRTREPMRFDSPLPPDLAAAAEWARGTST
jgi:23S rRNA pseudouridine1911/1915/1917 synthase